MVKSKGILNNVCRPGKVMDMDFNVSEVMEFQVNLSRPGKVIELDLNVFSWSGKVMELDLNVS